MANGPFRQMVDGSILLTNLGATAAVTTEQQLFPIAQYAGWGPNQLRSGQKWYLYVEGTGTCGGTAGNVTITPRFGLTSAGVALGSASAATAMVNSASAVRWCLEAKLTVRSVGLAGTNSVVQCQGKFESDVALIAASTGNVFLFGGAQASVDLSISSGFYIGVTFSNSGSSFTVSDVIVESYN